MQMNLTNRINVLRTISRNRCCSFCRNNGHTVNNCNDERLNEFELLCRSKKQNFSNSSENAETLFCDWLLEINLENPLLVKSFAIKKCGGSVRSSSLTIVQLIIDYFNYDGTTDDESSDLDDFISFRSNELQPLYTQDVLLDAAIGLLILSANQTHTQLLNIPRFTIDIQTIVASEKMHFDENCECGICYENISKQNIVKLSCNHEFCKECIKTTINICKTNRKDVNCAFCREKTLSIETSSDKIKLELDESIC